MCCFTLLRGTKKCIITASEQKFLLNHSPPRNRPEFLFVFASFLQTDGQFSFGDDFWDLSLLGSFKVLKGRKVVSEICSQQMAGETGTEGGWSDQRRTTEFFIIIQNSPWNAASLLYAVKEPKIKCYKQS